MIFDLLIKNRSKLDQNCNRRLEITFEIRIGPKLTIVIGWLGIRIGIGIRFGTPYRINLIHSDLNRSRQMPNSF